MTAKRFVLKYSGIHSAKKKYCGILSLSLASCQPNSKENNTSSDIYSPRKDYHRQ